MRVGYRVVFFLWDPRQQQGRVVADLALGAAGALQLPQL